MKKFGVALFIISAVFLLEKCKSDTKCATCNSHFKTTPYPFQVPVGFPKPNIPADNPMTVEGVNLGRYLFFDKNLSKDRSMSCASCHITSRMFSDPNPLSQGVNGELTRRHSMVLFNLAWQEKFFWDGRAGSLEEQALIPVTDPIELDSDWETVISRIETDPIYDDLFKKAFNTNVVSKELIGKAIAQFERTIVSANSKYDSVIRLGIADWDIAPNGVPYQEIGYELFTDLANGNCMHCHGEGETSFLLGAFGESLSFMNNGSVSNHSTDLGLKEVTGNAADFGKFKVPSLRNVALSAPYFHDGSVPTLDSIINFYDVGGQPNTYRSGLITEHGTARFSETEKIALREFLFSLTDFSFLNDTLYKDPRP